jgi:phosphoadenosine phosphosulfate reductase
MSVTREELARLAAALEGAPPERILAAVAERFPGKVGFATGFGAEGCVLIDVAARARIPLDVFTLDTGFLFPETYGLWRRLEARYGIVIRAVRAPLRPGSAGSKPVLSVAAEGREAEGLGVNGPEEDPTPWQTDPDRCCELRKVLPLRAELARLDAWATAIRRDQTPDRAGARVVEWDEKFGLVKVSPLAAWTARDVWAHVRAHDVPTNPLHEQGYTSIGCAPCTTPVVAGEDPRAGRWRGRQKTECGLHSRPAAPKAG